MLISSVLRILGHGPLQNRTFPEKGKTCSGAVPKAEAAEPADTDTRKRSARAIPAAVAGEPPSLFEIDADPVQPFPQVIRDFRRAVDEASKRPLATKLDLFE